MDAIEDDIKSGKAMEPIVELKRRIIDTAKNIKSNDVTFQIKTLPQVSGDLIKLMEGTAELERKTQAYQQAFFAVKSEIEERQESNIDIFRELFHAALHGEMSKVSLDKGALNELNRLLKPEGPVDEDIVVEAPAERVWPKDPITKTRIKKAVRSKQCNHIYDRSSIEAYIEQRKTNKQKASCPVAGCRNKNLTREDLVPDDETNNLIESMRDRGQK